MPTITDLNHIRKNSLQTKFVASKNTKSHKVKGKLPNSAKKMKACADGNNEMYKRRRMPEPLVVQQMKVGGFFLSNKKYK